MSKKIRIKKLPEGFEVKDGKVIEKNVWWLCYW